MDHETEAASCGERLTVRCDYCGEVYLTDNPLHPSCDVCEAARRHAMSQSDSMICKARLDKDRDRADWEAIFAIERLATSLYCWPSRDTSTTLAFVAANQAESLDRQVASHPGEGGWRLAARVMHAIADAIKAELAERQKEAPNA